MLLSELQSKDVINVVDGGKLGRIADVDMDIEEGKISFISVKPNTRLSGIFSGNNSVIIPWKQIVKIGGEIIIVNYNGYIK